MLSSQGCSAKLRNRVSALTGPTTCLLFEYVDNAT